MTTESRIAELEAIRRASLRNTDRDPNLSTVLPNDGLDNRQCMLDGQWYIVNHPESQVLSTWVGQVAVESEVAFRKDQQTAQRVLTPVLGPLGKNSTVRPPVYLDHSGNARTRDNALTNFGFTAFDVVKVTVCDHAQLGPNAQLLPPVYPLGTEAHITYLESGDEIIIRHNVWISGGVIILGGVRVGDSSVVAAGAMMTRDVPAGVVVTGNPAKIIHPTEA